MFRGTYAVWCGVALVAAVLTIPVAGTSLYLVDQYVTARTLSTPLSLIAVACVIEGRFVSAAACVLAMAFVHPLMTVFTVGYLVILLVFHDRQHREVSVASGLAALPVVPLWLFEPATPAYRRILETRPLHLITNWAWYEWLGVFAPALLLFWFSRLAERRRVWPMRTLCRSLITFEVVFCLIGVLIARPGRFEVLSEPPTDAGAASSLQFPILPIHGRLAWTVGLADACLALGAPGRAVMLRHVVRPATAVSSLGPSRMAVGGLVQSLGPGIRLIR